MKHIDTWHQYAVANITLCLHYAIILHDECPLSLLPGDERVRLAALIPHLRSLLHQVELLTNSDIQAILSDGLNTIQSSPPSPLYYYSYPSLLQLSFTSACAELSEIGLLSRAYIASSVITAGVLYDARVVFSTVSNLGAGRIGMAPLIYDIYTRILCVCISYTLVCI